MTSLTALKGYSRHGNRWLKPQEKAALVERINKFQELSNMAKKGHPYARRIIESVAQGLPVADIDREYTGFQETMSSSDLGDLTSELMNRSLLAAYATRSDWGWRQYVPVRSPVMDFRNVRPVAVDMIDPGTAPNTAVPEGATYRYVGFTDTGYSYQVAKYVEGIRYTWELSVNDDIGGIGQMLPAVANRNVGAHGRFVTSLHTDASGPSAALYTAPNGNIVTGNPDLSLAGLQIGINQLKNRIGPDGEPIMLSSAVLVVGDAGLELIANQIIATTTVDRVDGTDIVRSQGNQLPPLTVVFNPYVQLVATTANAATSWWLFPNVSDGRPWAETAFLQGFETPQMFRKRSEVEDLQGNLLPNMGSMATFAQESAVMSVFGGSVIDPIVTVASNGTNTP